MRALLLGLVLLSVPAGSSGQGDQVAVPDESYYEFASIDHYPVDACHTTADGERIFCYIQNVTDIEECIQLCTVDVNRCKGMKYTKLNECVFYIDNRTRDRCDDFGIDNIEEWTINNLNRGDEEADVISVTYTKKRDETGLRVRFNGNIMSGTDCNGCGISHWFKFNGAECSDPQPIDISWYNGNSQRYEHRHHEFEGICNNLNAGDINIVLHVGQLRSGHAYGDAYTGWSSHTRVLAEEIDLRQANYECNSLSVFNVVQKAAKFETGQDSGEITQLTFTYKKLASDTGIRLKTYVNMMGVHDQHCIRYYFTFNGQECSDPYPVDTALNFLHGSDNGDQYGSRGFEGICDGLPAGEYVIRLNLNSCPWGYHHMDAYTGWQSASRVIAEEVRYGLPSKRVTYKDGTTLETSVFNIQHWNWYNLYDTKTNDVIKSLNYKKLSDTSGIRVLFNAVVRVSEYRDRCTRWYFRFNDHDCSDPGEVEGIHFEYSYATEWFNKLRPKTVSGICRGTAQGPLQAGDVKIDLRIGDCQTGHSVGHNPITGFQSRMTIMAEEVNWTEG